MGVSAPTGDYTTVDIPFVAAGTSTTLTFQETSPTTASPIFDNILITTSDPVPDPLPDPVPEPANALLVGCAIGLLAVARPRPRPRPRPRTGRPLCGPAAPPACWPCPAAE